MICSQITWFGFVWIFALFSLHSTFSWVQFSSFPNEYGIRSCYELFCPKINRFYTYRIHNMDVYLLHNFQMNEWNKKITSFGMCHLTINLNREPNDKINMVVVDIHQIFSQLMSIWLLYIWNKKRIKIYFTEVTWRIYSIDS